MQQSIIEQRAVRFISLSSEIYYRELQFLNVTDVRKWSKINNGREKESYNHLLDVH